MESSAAQQRLSRDAMAAMTRFWWMWLVSGVVWVLIALVILQFDDASVATVGVLIGLMFLLSGIQQIALGAAVDGGKWVWYLFGVLLVAAGVVSLISPEETFAGFADMLGFLFLIVGVFWTVGAFVERERNELWWLGLLSGLLMVMLAFWTAGQFFIDKAYVLLVFAGVWALLHGATDLVRAFQTRRIAP